MATTRLGRLQRQLFHEAATVIQQFFCRSNIVLKASACKTIQRLVRVRQFRAQKSRQLKQRARSAVRIQRVFRKCNKNSFRLEKRLRWVLTNLVPASNIVCPITHALIRHPVFNFYDKNLYEKEAFCKWMDNKGTCPQTRKTLVGGSDYLKWLKHPRFNVIRKQAAFTGYRISALFHNDTNGWSFYTGKIQDYRPSWCGDTTRGHHFIRYDDQDRGWSNLQVQTVELLPNTD